MASWGTFVNASMGTAATLSGTPTGSALTPTSELSAIVAASNVDYFNRAAWRVERDLARPSLPSAESDIGQTDQGSKPRSSGEVVVGLKRWEGRILEISDGLLTVELTPSDHDGPELVADFDVDLLGPDSSSAGPGDIIYLTTRTVRDTTGYPYQTSSLKLRRPGPWGEDELSEIQEIAKWQAEFFKGTE
jgi:hypothetical protein